MPYFDTGRKPCESHQDDCVMCSCGYIRQDAANRLAEDRRKTKLNKRRKGHAQAKGH